MILTPDWPIRQEALDPTKSFICEAPAGSGKTELLTQRFLTLLASVSNPEAVLAITFTKKASAEMQARVLNALLASLDPMPASEHARTTWHLAQKVLITDQKYQWHLLENPNRLQIRTFDSLCLAITQTLPLQSQLGQSVQLNDRPETLYREASIALVDQLDHNNIISEALKTLLLHLDNQHESLIILLCKMLAKREIWLPLLYKNDLKNPDTSKIKAILEHHLKSAIHDKVEQLHSLIPSTLQSEVCALASFAAAHLPLERHQEPIRSLLNLIQLPSTHEADIARWRGLSQLMLTEAGAWRKRLDKNIGFPAGVTSEEKKIFKHKKEQFITLLDNLSQQQGLEKALQMVTYWPDPKYSDRQWILLQALLDVLPFLVAHLHYVLNAKQQVDFSEISQRARLGLGTDDAPTDLAMRLDYQIQHILVDEFQDTSFNQIDLLNKLTQNWMPGEGKTLFCVGDAMQSIYSFRNANVGLFLKCKQYGLGHITLHPLQLTANFRSHAILVNWFNKTFCSAFPNKPNISDGAVPYAKAEPIHNTLAPGINVETHIIDVLSDRDVEGQLLNQWILESKLHHPSGTIAVLVKDRKQAAKVITQLKYYNHSYHAVELERLAKQPIVFDLMSLTCALLFPYDTESWVAILRAPWCGLTLDDLETLRHLKSTHHTDNIMLSQLKELVWEQLENALESIANGSTLFSEDGKIRITRVATVLIQALNQRHRLNLREWIETTWWQLGGPACINTIHEKEHALQFFEFLERWSTQEWPNAAQLKFYLETLYAAPDPQGDDRLQVLTIHKSKGLEFDTVILPYLDAPAMAPEKSLLLWQERLNHAGDEELLLAPVSTTHKEKEATYRFLEQEQKRREMLERGRLIYVACTRAKKSLYLNARIKTNSNNTQVDFKDPIESSLLSPIWLSIKTQCQYHPPHPAIELTPTGGAYTPISLTRLPTDWLAPAAPQEPLLKPYRLPKMFNNINLMADHFSIHNTPKPESTKILGTFIHELLQYIVQQGVDKWINIDLLTKHTFWTQRLLSLGLPVDNITQALQLTTQSIKNVLNCEHFLNLLKYQHSQECSIAHNEKTYKLDLLIYRSHNCAYIIDYKTSTPSSEQNIQDFIQHEVEHHRPQLLNYRNALVAMGYTETYLILFFVTANVWFTL